jgi:hypothetical protein
VSIYVPILKARVSEFVALDHAEPPVAAAMRPLLEVMQEPSGSLNGSVLDFGDKLMEAAPKDMIFAVDCRYLRAARSEVSESPLSLLAWHIHDRGIRMIPVFSPGDDQNPRDVRRAVVLHKAGGCLRLGLQYLAQECDEDRGDHVPELLDVTGLAPTDVDLVIDLGEVCSHAARERAARMGRAALSWARRHPWRSVTVAAGAFPGDIGEFPVGDFTSVSRWDAYLWSALTGPQMSREEIGFGDYAVSNPRLLDSWSPLPSLRYTSKRHWHVYRYPRSASGALTTFHDLCEAVISSGHWPELGGEFSWGDQQIEEIARRFGGPGDATLWRAFGVSHHMAVVLDRLERIGEP